MRLRHFNPPDLATVALYSVPSSTFPGFFLHPPASSFCRAPWTHCLQKLKWIRGGRRLGRRCASSPAA